MLLSLSLKTLEILLALFGVSLVAFFLIRLVPGDPVELLTGLSLGSDDYDVMAHQFGLSGPLWQQYVIYVSNLLHGDLGTSLLTHGKVADDLFPRWAATIELGLLAFSVAWVIGIPLGIFASLKQGTYWDSLISGFTLLGYSLPLFWWAMILILIFSVYCGLTPVSGRIDVLYEIENKTGFMLIDTLSWEARNQFGLKAFCSAVSHLILPVFAMATIPLAALVKVTRASMLDILASDMIRTARSKGLSAFQVVVKHALRSALNPILTLSGLMFVSSVVAGAMIAESIFCWPGIGRYLLAAIHARDYPCIQSSIFFVGAVIVVLNSILDVLLGVLNPTQRVAK